MKGGFLKATKGEGLGRQPAAGKVAWSEDLVTGMVEVLQEVLEGPGSTAKLDLLRRVRSGTVAKSTELDDAELEEPAVDVCCGGHGGSKGDIASRLVEQHTRAFALRDSVGPVCEETASMFTRVKARGEAEGCRMDSETEAQVRGDILKEVLVRHLARRINEANSYSHMCGSTDGGLLATPAGYQGGDLNSISNECIRGLMERGYGYQDSFLDREVLKQVIREVELMEFDGQLVEVQQERMRGVRTDKIGWFCTADLDREKQPGLGTLFKKLISLPFELNKKCSLMLQAGDMFQVAHYAKDGFYRQHMDGGYEDNNNGRKITAIWYANSQSWGENDGGFLRMYKRKPNPYQKAKAAKTAATDSSDAPAAEEAEELLVEEDIAPRGDRLVLFRARDMPHEVLPVGRKRFAVSFYIKGPPGPGDDDDIQR